MEAKRRPFVLIAEDDLDSRLIYTEVLKKTAIQVNYKFIGSGPELLDNLKDPSKQMPCLVITDLKSPMDAHILESIMEDQLIRAVPIVVLTSEQEEAEARRAYASCVNSYIMKPGPFSDFVEIMNRIFCYWFRTVKLPW